MKSPTISASVAEAMTFRMTFARIRMGPLKIFPSLFPRKWNPLILLRASGSTRYDASDMILNVDSDASYLVKPESRRIMVVFHFLGGKYVKLSTYPS